MYLTNRGKLYSFGYASHGQLGLRTTQNKCTPQLVTDLEDQIITQIAAGWNHSLVLNSEGDLYTCGHGKYGQLGLGESEPKSQFTIVDAMQPKNIYKIYAGGNHSWVVLDDVLPFRDAAEIRNGRKVRNVEEELKHP